MLTAGTGGATTASSGADRRDDRELPFRSHVELHEALPVSRHGTASRGLRERMALGDGLIIEDAHMGVVIVLPRGEAFETNDASGSRAEGAPDDGSS